MPISPHRNPRSWLSLLLGATCLGTGLAWMLATEWGVAPLDAFIAGSASVTGLTIGTVIILLSIFFLAAAWLLGSRPGIGTPITFIGVGVVVDVWNIVIFETWGLSPDLWPVVIRLLVWLFGFGLFAGGIIATLASELGANPYDQIVYVVHERFGLRLAYSRLAFDGAMLLLAFVIGGAWGVGTVAILILLPFVMGFLTPRLRRWIHRRDHDAPSKAHNASGTADS